MPAPQKSDASPGTTGGTSSPRLSDLLLASAAREAKVALANGWVEGKDPPEGYDEHVMLLTSSTKPQLAQRLHAWAREHGQQWTYGGPDVWSKDELVSACARIYRGEQP